MKLYRKIPIVIEAGRWFTSDELPDIISMYDVSNDNICQECGKNMYSHGWIQTLEGEHIVCPGDWVIKGIEGEYYSCKDRIFKKIYTEE